MTTLIQFFDYFCSLTIFLYQNIDFCLFFYFAGISTPKCKNFKNQDLQSRILDTLLDAHAKFQKCLQMPKKYPGHSVQGLGIAGLNSFSTFCKPTVKNKLLPKLCIRVTVELENNRTFKILQKNKKLVVRVNPAIPTIFSNFQV
jgi:hypothetical protein